MNLNSTKSPLTSAGKKSRKGKKRTGDRLIKAVASTHSTQNWVDKFDDDVVKFCDLTYPQAISQLNSLLKRAGQEAKKVKTRECFGHEYCRAERLLETISQMTEGLTAVNHASAIAGRDIKGSPTPCVWLQLGDKPIPVYFGLSEGHRILNLEKDHPVFRELFWFLRNWEWAISALWGARLFGEIGRIIVANRLALPSKTSAMTTDFGFDNDDSGSLYRPWEGPLREEIDLVGLSDSEIEEINKILNDASFGSGSCGARAAEAFSDWIVGQKVSRLLKIGLTVEEIHQLVCHSNSSLGPHFEVKLKFDQNVGCFHPVIPLLDHRGDGGNTVELSQLPFLVATEFFKDTPGLAKEDLTRLVLREYYERADRLVGVALEKDLY